MFDCCAARVERRCGCTRRGDQTQANEPQVFPHTAMCTTAVDLRGKFSAIVGDLCTHVNNV
jgi:hypothetical protein